MLTGKSKRLSKRSVVFISTLVVLAAAVTTVFTLIYQKGYYAKSMRLLNVEGTVNIETADGGTKPVIDNIRFQSGDALSTGADGFASVGLDATKIITLQNDSRFDVWAAHEVLTCRAFSSFQFTSNAKYRMVATIEWLQLSS